MTMILRDWLLDPLGLVVLWTGALLLVAALVGGGRRRGRRRARRAGAGVPAGRREGRDGGGAARRLARRAAFFAAWYAGLAAVSAPAVVNPLVASLEGREPIASCPVGTPVVVLGGGIDSAARDVASFESMSASTLARVSEAGRLAAAEPGVRVVVAGGALGTVAEADLMAEWLVRTGTPRDTIVAERESMNTAANARGVAASLAGTGAVRIRLVTSALHMPRAAGAFRAAGFDPCPVPVERIALADVPAWVMWPQVTSLVKFDRWLHEALALALYRRRGDLADVAPVPVAPRPQTS